MVACGVSLIRAGVSTPELVVARLRLRLAAARLGMAIWLTDTRVSEALCRGDGEGCTGRPPKGQVCAPLSVLWRTLGLWMAPNEGHGLRDARRTHGQIQ